MENILYNDLIRRGFDVDVGVVEYNTRDEDDKKIRKQLEVDFVINRGNATAADIRNLMQNVADIVEEKFGVRLEPEVKMIGEF